MIFGGYIADYPDAPRRWPDGPLSGPEPREVKIILASFGGGYTWGSIYIKWAYDGKNV